MDDIIERHPEYENLVADGITFLETMNRIYGPERAHDLWLGMKEAMGRDLQMHIFNSMLKGESGNHIKFKVLPNTKGFEEAVNTIKAIREYAGCGLKEAKDLWDNAKYSGQWTQITFGQYYTNPHETKSLFRRRIVQRLRELGHQVA